MDGTPLLDISADPAARRIILREGTLTPDKIAALRGEYAVLHKTYPGWTFQLQADPGALPPLSFASGSSALDPAGATLLDNIVWWLGVSGTQSVRVIGYSDTSGSAVANRFTALKRAHAVAALLQGAGISAAASENYPVPDQYRQEREFGEASFRRVEIVPGAK